MADPPSSTSFGETLRASRFVRTIGAVSLVTVALVTLLDLRLRAVQHQTLTRRVRDEATVPSPGATRVLSLGHREWAADLLWSAALLYFGETVATHAQQRFLQKYAETLEAVDPNFRRAYLWGATISIYNTRVIRRESVEYAIGHLERGLRAFPDDGEMLYQLGFDYYFELPRFAENSSERTEWKRRGAEYLRRAAGMGYGPPWMALAAAEALRDVGLADQAVEQLRDVYLRTEDATVRARLRAQIQELSGHRAETDPVLEAARELQHERLSSVPYMAPFLYLFVGPPVPGVANYAPIERTPLGAEMRGVDALVPGGATASADAGVSNADAPATASTTDAATSSATTDAAAL